MFLFDHIAVGCTELSIGVAWVEEKLGVFLQPGGQHVHYGTHNMLLGLGPDLYLEVIAKDPSAKPTGRPTWFGLDHFTGPPRLANWICRNDDLAIAPEMTGPAVALTRGDLKWELTVPDSGDLPMGGGFPSLMKWGAGVTPPSGKLLDRGCRLKSWTVLHPDAEMLRDMVPLHDPRVYFETGPLGFEAVFETQSGLRYL